MPKGSAKFSVLEMQPLYVPLTPKPTLLQSWDQRCAPISVAATELMSLCINLTASCTRPGYAKTNGHPASLAAPALEV